MSMDRYDLLNGIGQMWLPFPVKDMLEIYISTGKNPNRYTTDEHVEYIEYNEKDPAARKN